MSCLGDRCLLEQIWFPLISFHYFPCLPFALPSVPASHLLWSHLLGQLPVHLLSSGSPSFSLSLPSTFSPSTSFLPCLWASLVSRNPIYPFQGISLDLSSLNNTFFKKKKKKKENNTTFHWHFSAFSRFNLYRIDVLALFSPNWSR